MKGKKRTGILVVATSLVLFSTTALASPTLCYYSFSSPWGAGSLTNPIESPHFTVTNTRGYVSIYGWQDTPYGGTPVVKYELMKDEWGFDSSVASQPISGVYPKYGNWYYHTFNGAANGSVYYIKMTPQSSTGMDGAGNAYDGL